MNPQRKKNRLYAVTLFWIIVLGGTGVAQRLLRHVMEASAGASVVLEKPLASLSLQVGPWEGVDVPMEARITQRAANDDYVNRRYVDHQGNQFVDLFVAYTASPAVMLGHRPDLCYPAIGWKPAEQVKKVKVPRADGGTLECLIHRFVRGEQDSEGLVVLNYYVLQGKHTTDAEAFRGARWRRPNMARDFGFYVAQVQVVHPVYITSLMDRGEATVKQFASDLAGPIDRLLPLTDRTRQSAQPRDPKRDFAGESSGIKVGDKSPGGSELHLD